MGRSPPTVPARAMKRPRRGAGALHSVAVVDPFATVADSEHGRLAWQWCQGRPANEQTASAGGVERLADVRRFRRAGPADTPDLPLPDSIQYVARDPRTEAPAPSPLDRPELPVHDHPPPRQVGTVDVQTPHHQPGSAPCHAVRHPARHRVVGRVEDADRPATWPFRFGAALSTHDRGAVCGWPAWAKVSSVS
jgi:hypothetical protein